jgi:cytochrome c556
MKPLMPFCLLAVSALTIGASSPGKEAAHARHEKFEQIGKAFKQVTDQLKRRPPDLAKARAGVAAIAELAPQIGAWFPVGSGPQDGVRTDAKAEAWTERAELLRIAASLNRSLPALDAAAAAGDLAALGAAVRTTGATCKSCHDKFRKD